MNVLPDDLHLNTSFSSELRGFQFAVDSTSLGEFKTCPRKYLLGVVWGWQPKEESVHLTFGLLIHSARETYDHLRARGAQHEEALITTVHSALRATWNAELKRPWLSGDPNKNRNSLIRSIVWYFDQFAQDPLETVIGTDGRPLVELSFRFDSGHRSGTGEMVELCGHGDRIATLNEDPYWVDTKTTKHALDGKYFSQFNPHNQFSIYDIAGRVVFKQPTRGLILDGLQVGATFTRAKRHLVHRDDHLRNEWLQGFSFWSEQMEKAATDKHWPMNDTACDQYFGCKFRDICSRSPASREQWLKASFKRRTWDPLQRRGDI